MTTSCYVYDSKTSPCYTYDLMGTENRQPTTEHQEPETGLYYYGLRFYSPTLGRWLSRDPMEEWATKNLYVFVGNNSVFWVDPDGLLRIWPFKRRLQPEYEIVVQGSEPTFPREGIGMCQEELVGKKVIGILHHRFIVFDGDARGFEKRTPWLWGGRGGVRDEAKQPLHNDVSCYKMTCLKKDCAREIFDKAVSSGEGKRYWLGFRDCQSWANNVEISMYKQCEYPCCPEEEKKGRRSTWKHTGWRQIKVQEEPEPAPEPDPDPMPWPQDEGQGPGFPIIRIPF